MDLNRNIPYGRQWVDNDDIEEVIKILKSDYLTTGPAVERFEQDMADYVGSKYAVAFSSGTAALHAACFAAGIKAGDEVVTSSMTFAASANCVIYQGATPKFAEINPNNGNINPASIEECITDKTKAIIPVHYTGRPTEMDEILDIAQRYNLIVIEDAAHALGALYKKKKIGSISDMTMFSFHPVKNITTGEGGVITTNNKKYFQTLQQFRSHGVTRDPQGLVNQIDGPWYYEMQFLGYNYRMTDIQAALGSSQLKKLDFFIQKRREIVKYYNGKFKNIGVIKPLNIDAIESSSWHLYVVRLELNKLVVSRKKIVELLLEEKINVNVHYIPVYKHPYYQSLGYDYKLHPATDQFYESIITLPLYPSMTNDQVSKICEVFMKIISKYMRAN
ncbi:UDP-4-amino-4,6-dideoxy-N-acetyl-beta-L-altrosamine transaminase [Halobacillus litoralis]|uniref:UDP-4-amino-4, 6-dideoxy-N-acetyl-beta-L-altrosamine transaminase n=1 Tax=Halobacillus litoralis TaxID=45668 RepID=UPI001CD549F7|nr:UDP-4-amino-4,6-dideoxy-N-acetyl-beta-L-altrosamine transaminase [Halobacillus litoralis]MCA0971581.1 UDP-4-amino-4,6-dideoxy-N-acetyl-beta-L-altrosamine transaminase [Halobacillus litoralis]